MNIAGILKTTLLDYPGTMATTLFTPSCNMRCPFCHNSDLVLNDNLNIISEEEILSFLKKRKNVLEGVCITGGEPTLQKDLIPFIKDVKSLGYKIKLDTNGLNPKIIENITHNKLVDYIAMDIKNSLDKYNITCGTTINISNIKESVDIIMESGIDYEFRTTIIKQFHNEEDLINIGKWLRGATDYYLQQYKYGEKQLNDQVYSYYNKEELNYFKNILSEYFTHVNIRGI
jgi:pyruvate formate lyase activating enzyme